MVSRFLVARLQVVNRWIRIWCVVWLAAAGLCAAPLLDEPVAALTLRNGTVLRQALAKGFLTKVVLVQCAGGLRTVPYEQFPEEFQEALAGRRQAALAAVEKQARERPPTIARRPAQSAPPAAGTSFEMASECRLTVTGTRGDVILLRIENRSAFPAAVHPWQIAVRTVSGRVVTGAHWVGLNDEGRVVVTLLNRQLIDGRAAVDLALAVAPSLENDAVDAVLWR